MKEKKKKQSKKKNKNGRTNKTNIIGCDYRASMKRDLKKNK